MQGNTMQVILQNQRANYFSNTILLKFVKNNSNE